MTPDKVALRTYFAKLGLEAEIADVYLSLYAQGPQTISELSRSSQVERTRIYRLIDQLMASGLIEVETRLGRALLKPAPISNLRILISRREQELQSLQDELQMVEQALGRNSLSSPAARVQFYQGIQGIRQMLWNQTQARSEVCAIVHEAAPIKTDSRYTERWINACNKASLNFRIITSGDASEAANPHNWYAGPTDHHLKYSQSRRLAPAVFPIVYSTIAYDDVVVNLVRKDGDAYGIETHNNDIAASQRAIFDLLWQTTAS